MVKNEPLYCLMYDGHNHAAFISICPEFNFEVWDTAPINHDYVGNVLQIRGMTIYPGNYVVFRPDEIIILSAIGGIYDWNKRS